MHSVLQHPRLWSSAPLFLHGMHLARIFVGILTFNLYLVMVPPNVLLLAILSAMVHSLATQPLVIGVIALSNSLILLG